MRSRNVGWRDAGVRGFVGLTLLILSAMFGDRPLIALGIGFIAMIFIGTALFGMCPIYTLLGINTAPRTL